MAKNALRLVDPASLEAVQVYSPRFIASAESILKIDIFFRKLIEIPSSSCIFLLFKVQVILIGKSPRVIIQFVAIVSPVFIGSVPNSNGTICGGTEL